MHFAYFSYKVQFSKIGDTMYSSCINKKYSLQNVNTILLLNYYISMCLLGMAGKLR